MTVTLFDALTGNSTVVDAGDGSGSSRMRSWLEEISGWLREAVEPLALKGLGIGRVANFPANLTGERITGFSGASFFRVIPQTAVMTLADGTAVNFGSVALTEDDRTHADYFNTTTDPDDPVAPRGATAPAFLQSLVDGGGFDLQATNGNLTIKVNGTTYSITSTVLQGAAVTVEIIRDLLTAAGWPVDIQIEGADTLRIFAPGNGVTANILGVAVTGDVGTALFTGASQSSQPNVTYTGKNGPLGVMDNTEVVGSGKPQRRILPGSVEVSATVSGSTVTLTDDGLGVLSSGAHTGTINYETGAISVTFGTAPTNATNVTAKWKALKVLILTDPARLSPAGLEVALLLN